MQWLLRPRALHRPRSVGAPFAYECEQAERIIRLFRSLRLIERMQAHARHSLNVIDAAENECAVNHKCGSSILHVCSMDIRDADINHAPRSSHSDSMWRYQPELRQLRC